MISIFSNVDFVWFPKSKTLSEKTRVSVLEEKFEVVSLAASHFRDFEERFHHLEQRVKDLESRAP